MNMQALMQQAQKMQKDINITKEIEDLYKDSVYILKLWAIESYPRLERKWFVLFQVLS